MANEDVPLTISGGDVILDKNFESGSSVLEDTCLHFDKIKNENGAPHNCPRAALPRRLSGLKLTLGPR